MMTNQLKHTASWWRQTSFCALAAACALHAAEFAATGPVKETNLPPAQFPGAVKVTFDLLPATMSFDLPWHFCSVSENGLKFAHFTAETCDPREWDGTGADGSFEAGMDKEGRRAREGSKSGGFFADGTAHDIADTMPEQVYPHVITGSEKPQNEILKLASSCISLPCPQMPDAGNLPAGSNMLYNVP